MRKKHYRPEEIIFKLREAYILLETRAHSGSVYQVHRNISFTKQKNQINLLKDIVLAG
jgi:hypothetical protein